jgi:hypothetical protein
VVFLELLRQCGIFWNCCDSVVFFFLNCSDSVVFFGIVPTVWYFLELLRQCGIFWNCSDSVVFFGIVATVEQFQKIPHCRNNSKKYHTIGTIPKNTTLSEQFQKIPHCRNNSKKYHTVATIQKNTTLSHRHTYVARLDRLMACTSNF